MPPEHVKTFERAVAALNRRDLDAFLGLTHPEVVFTPLIAQMEGGASYPGHKGIRKFWKHLHDVFPHFKVSIVERRELGDVVLAHARLAGSGAGSGVGIGQHVWQLAEFRQGRIIRYAAFTTELDAVEAARLPGTPAHSAAQLPSTGPRAS
jgi:ketosteroid isomerase-like protein